MSDRLGWYRNRLRAMDVREVPVRVRRELESRADAAAWNVAPALWRHAWEPADRRIMTAGPIEQRPLGFLTAERAALAAGAAPASVPPLVDRASAVLGRRVRYFGYDEVTLEDPPDLARDPFTGRRWPDAHGKLLDYRRADCGDPKWIWELNRCQELPLLCLAWRLSGEERFAEAAQDRLVAWLAGSRPGRGIAWSNGFEAALRGTSFALTLDALRGSGLLTENDARVVLRGLWQHGRWILRDRSFGSSANNHLIGEAAGLVAIGLLAPELVDGERWVAQGVRLLEEEVDVQILPDGAGAEQAFAYHLFVCDLLLLVEALVQARGGAPSARIEAALRRSADALTLQLRPGEPEPAYGDADDGRAFLFDADETRTATAVAASLACSVGHGAAAALAGSPDLPAVLLFGAPGRERFATADGNAPGSGVLPAGGLVVVRRNGTRTTFDAGPLGYRAIVAHGHADGLSVTFSDGDRELVTDPGTGTYFGDPARRHHFRSTLAHGTVTVDGLDQAVYGGPFLWLRHPETTLRFVDLATGAAVGETDAWSRLEDPVRHRRALVVLPSGALLVYDRLDGRLPHRYAQTWPLHPSLELSERASSLFDALLEGMPVLLAALAPGDAVVRTSRGRDGVSESLWSRRLERMEPAWTIRQEIERPGPGELAALLVPVRGAAHRDPELRLTQEGSTTLAEFTLGEPGADGTTWQVRLDLDDPELPVRIDGSA